MKKIILLLAMVILSFHGSLQADQSKIQGLSPADEAYVARLCKNSGRIFKAMAKQYNYRADTDDRFKDKPAIERPHITSQQAAALVRQTIKTYRNGDERSAKFLEGATSVLNIEAPFETKVDVMDYTAKCYLSLVAGPKND